MRRTFNQRMSSLAETEAQLAAHTTNREAARRVRNLRTVTDHLPICRQRRRQGVSAVAQATYDGRNAYFRSRILQRRCKKQTKTPHSGVASRPTISAEDRRFIIDSGASLHMRSKDALTPDGEKIHQEFAATSRPEDIWLE